MNLQHALAVLVLSAAGSAASAIEATQMTVPPSTLTRAEVRAELARARANGELMSSAEAEQRPFELAAAPLRRDDVRREARAVAAAPFNPLYVGG